MNLDTFVDTFVPSPKASPGDRLGFLRGSGFKQNVEPGSLRHPSHASEGIAAAYADAIAAVADFADPILSGEITSGEWDPVMRTCPVMRTWRT